VLRFDDDLADEVESGGVTVPVVPAAHRGAPLLHAVIIAMTVISRVGVHTVLVTVPVVRLTGSPGHVPAVSAYFSPRTDPRPSILGRHVVSARPDISAAPLRCN